MPSLDAWDIPTLSACKESQNNILSPGFKCNSLKSNGISLQLELLKLVDALSSKTPSPLTKTQPAGSNQQLLDSAALLAFAIIYTSNGSVDSLIGTPVSISSAIALSGLLHLTCPSIFTRAQLFPTSWFADS